MTTDKSDRNVNERNQIVNTERRLRWVPVKKMRVSPRAQRSHTSPASRARIADITQNFDPDLLGYPIVAHQKGPDIYWIVDGAHRYYGLIGIGYEDQLVQCWVYEDLAEADQADKFLRHNDVKAVAGMDKFHVAIVAGWHEETDIDRIVRAANMSVGNGRDAIGCVGALRRTYAEAGPAGLSLTIRIIRDAYGSSGFNAKTVEGIGKFVINYEGVFDEGRAVAQLSKAHGGVSGLMNRAQKIRDQYGVTVAVGVAAAAVEIYNAGLKGRAKLNGWWSTFNGITNPTDN